MTIRLGLAIALAAALLSIGAGPVVADGPVVTVDWTTTPPASGTVVDGAVRLDAPATGATFRLVAFDVPDLGHQGYAVRGMVRYTGIEGTGYLELWSDFRDGSRYFSRTLGTSGPMAALTGTSDWRAFELPFFLEGADPPSRLEVNVILPSRGSAEVGRLEVVTIAGAASGRPGAWLSDQSLGAAGAIVGSALGILGALVGALASRGRGRRFVLAVLVAAPVAGLAAVGAAVVALVVGQPLGVVGLLALVGAIAVVAFGAAGPSIRRTYAEAELRRMRAMDRA